MKIFAVVDTIIFPGVEVGTFKLGEYRIRKTAGQIFCRFYFNNLQQVHDFEDAMGNLGTAFRGFAAREFSTVGFEALERNVAPALDILADVVRNSQRRRLTTVAPRTTARTPAADSATSSEIPSGSAILVSTGLPKVTTESIPSPLRYAAAW